MILDSDNKDNLQTHTMDKTEQPQITKSRKRRNRRGRKERRSGRLRAAIALQLGNLPLYHTNDSVENLIQEITGFTRDTHFYYIETHSNPGEKFSSAIVQFADKNHLIGAFQNFKQVFHQNFPISVSLITAEMSSEYRSYDGFTSRFQQYMDSIQPHNKFNNKSPDETQRLKSFPISVSQGLTSSSSCALNTSKEKLITKTTEYTINNSFEEAQSVVQDENLEESIAIKSEPFHAQSEDEDSNDSTKTFVLKPDADNIYTMMNIKQEHLLTEAVVKREPIDNCNSPPTVIIEENDKDTNEKCSPQESVAIQPINRNVPGRIENTDDTNTSCNLQADLVKQEPIDVCDLPPAAVVIDQPEDTNTNDLTPNATAIKQEPNGSNNDTPIIEREESDISINENLNSSPTEIELNNEQVTSIESTHFASPTKDDDNEIATCDYLLKSTKVKIPKQRMSKRRRAKIKISERIDHLLKSCSSTFDESRLIKTPRHLSNNDFRNRTDVDEIDIEINEILDNMDLNSIETSEKSNSVNKPGYSKVTIDRNKMILNETATYLMLIERLRHLDVDPLRPFYSHSKLAMKAYIAVKGYNAIKESDLLECSWLHVKNIPIPTCDYSQYLIKRRLLNIIYQKNMTSSAKCEHTLCDVTRSEHLGEALINLDSIDQALHAYSLLNGAKIGDQLLDAQLDIGYLNLKQHMKIVHNTYNFLISDKCNMSQPYVIRTDVNNVYLICNTTKIHHISIKTPYNNNMRLPNINNMNIPEVTNTNDTNKRKNMDGDEAPAPKQSKFEAEVRHAPIPATSSTPNVSRQYMPALPAEERSSLEELGLKLEFLKKFGLPAVLSNTIILRDLHELVDEAKLREVFLLAGDVKQVLIQTEKRTARVTFDHPVEAVQAIVMFYNQKLFDKPIIMQMDSSGNKRPLPVGLSGVNRGLARNGEALKGVRTFMELREINEILYELNKMDKFLAYDVGAPFHVWYSRRTNNKCIKPPLTLKPYVMANCTVPKAKNLPITASSSFNVLESAQKIVDCITPGDTQPLEILGSIFKRRNIISTGTDCTNGKNILDALHHRAVNNKRNVSNIRKFPNVQHPNMIQNIRPNHFNLENENFIPTRDVNSTLPTPTLIPPVIQPSTTQPDIRNWQRQTSGDHLRDPRIQHLNNHINPMVVPTSTFIPNIPNWVGNNESWNQQIQHSMNNINATMIPNRNVIPPPPPANQLDLRNIKRRENPQNPRIQYLINDINAKLIQTPTAIPDFRNLQGHIDLPDPSVQYVINYTNTTATPTLTIIPPTPPTRPPDIQNGEKHSDLRDPRIQHSSLVIPTPTVIPPPLPSTSPPDLRNRERRDSRDDSRDQIKQQLPDKETRNKSDGIAKLIFRNLPPSVDRAALLKVLRGVGDVLCCELPGTGAAFVAFKTLAHGERCIRLFHHSKVDGQTIEVVSVN